jgi:hypothetical protein
MDRIPATLPDWLSSAPTPAQQTALPRFPVTADQVHNEMITFEAAFEPVLDILVEGGSVTSYIDNDPRNINYGRFMRWIKKDPTRVQRYEEAQEIGTEALLEKMDRIADGTDNEMEDIDRSKLRLAQYKFKVQSHNKRRYGESKQVDLTTNVNIDVRALLDKREQQISALGGVTIDGDFTQE